MWICIINISRKTLPFPAVTVCNNNKLSKSRILGSPYEEIIKVDDMMKHAPNHTNKQVSFVIVIIIWWWWGTFELNDYDKNKQTKNKNKHTKQNICINFGTVSAYQS